MLLLRWLACLGLTAGSMNGGARHTGGGGSTLSNFVRSLIPVVESRYGGQAVTATCPPGTVIGFGEWAAKLGANNKTPP